MNLFYEEVYFYIVFIGIDLCIIIKRTIILEEELQTQVFIVMDHVMQYP